MEVRITKTHVALAALFVLAGVGLGSLLSPLVETALANVGQTVNISDHSASAYFAKVSSDGKLAVGDGAGPLSVDGTVASRLAAPASPWSASTSINGFAAPGQPIAGPSSVPINLTSLSLSTEAASGSDVDTVLYGGHVLSSATSCSPPANFILLWRIRDLGDGTTPLSFTFPTPLQEKPNPPSFKACLYAFTTTSSVTTINAVGFYGG
jgi:hypothetical protein